MTALKKKRPQKPLTFRAKKTKVACFCSHPKFNNSYLVSLHEFFSPQVDTGTSFVSETDSVIDVDTNVEDTSHVAHVVCSADETVLSDSVQDVR